MPSFFGLISAKSHFFLQVPSPLDDRNPNLEPRNGSKGDVFQIGRARNLLGLPELVYHAGEYRTSVYAGVLVSSSSSSSSSFSFYSSSILLSPGSHRCADPHDIVVTVPGAIMDSLEDLNSTLYLSMVALFGMAVAFGSAVFVPVRLDFEVLFLALSLYLSFSLALVTSLP